MKNWLYEIGREIPEILGSGSYYQYVSSYSKFENALMNYKKGVHNYLIRWKFEDGFKRTEEYNFETGEFEKI